MTLSEIALKYINAGLSVLPIRPDGSKAPDLPEWKRFQEHAPSIEECSHFRQESGIAVICGAVSGNLEVIDCDDAASFTAWAELVESQLGHEFFARLTIVKTPRPGFHVYLRCDTISGNLKLAQISRQVDYRPTIKTLIETRGEGGYVLAPGCPGACHETGGTYQVAQGTFSTIPRITTAERDVLLSAARSFNQVFRDVEVHREMRDGESVGSEFCAKAEWAEILKPHGFKSSGRRGELELWTRPGKDHGVSASTNYAGSGLFYSFSTNCYPFESERGYNKFGVYSLLNHDGDFKAAVKDLVRRGYGMPRPSTTAINPSLEILPANTLRERLMALYEHGVEHGVDPGWPSVRECWTVRKGEWTLITGIPSHGKSSFVDAVMMNLARREGWSWAVYSAENLPHELHLINLLEQYVGKPFHRGMTMRMSEPEIRYAMGFIEDHFRFLAPPEEEETLPRLLQLAESMDIDGVSIDPWNELSHDYAGGTETDYISRQLKILGRYCKRKQVHAFIVAHPAKLRKENSDGQMKYPVPGPYDISGSAHWRNKADNCLCVWRDESTPGKSEIYIQKIRRRFVGKVGIADLNFDIVTGRFSDPRYVREAGDEA